MHKPNWKTITTLCLLGCFAALLAACSAGDVVRTARIVATGDVAGAQAMAAEKAVRYAADPRALTLCLEAWQVQERLGSPEGELAIAQAVVYMACAAKSNAVYTAFGAARRDARDLGTLEVPLHLRNAPTQLMKELDYGKDYRYAHDEPDAFAAGETYFPDAMQVKRYYHPVERGLEIRIAEKLNKLRELDQTSQEKLTDDG